MGTTPVVSTTNAASSDFWNIQATDVLNTALSALTTLSTAKTAKALANSQQSTPPSSTADSVRAALTAPTNLTTLAATVGAILLVTAGGLWVWHKVR